MTEPRRWRMHAGLVDPPVNDRRLMNFGDPRTVRFNGRKPVAVELTEDPEGDYFGWIRTGEESPILIQPSRAMFTIQFHYGPEVEQEWGRGTIVRLSVREVEG